MKQGRNYRVVSFEGGDQVGKGDAVLNLSSKLLSLGIPVTYSSFPIYATPLGTMVRFALKGGLSNFNLDKKRELKIRMALFALNRLEFMEVLLSNPKYKKTLIMLDRSSFSNSVTLGYGLSTIEDITKKEIEEFVEYFLWLDSFMIKKMNLANCVIQLATKDGDWKNSRGEAIDEYEKSNVQENSEKIYGICEKKFGDGWRKIITKAGDNWRNREDISNDIYEFLVDRIGGLNENFESKMFEVRYEIGIEEILGQIYKGESLPEGILTEYLKALRSNDKENMYKFGTEIGVTVGKTCQLMKFSNKGVKKAARAIIDDLNEIIEISSVLISKGFSKKFRDSVYD